MIKCLEKSPSIKELVEIKRISRIFGGTYIDMHEICHLSRTLRTNKINQSSKEIDLRKDKIVAVKFEM